TQGPLVTDAQGRFSLAFLGLPDPGSDSMAKPVYYFEVEVEITDLGGETRMAQTQIPLGYTSIILGLDLPSSASREALAHIPVRVTNLEGVAQDLPFRIRIHGLEGPGQLLRSRYWAPPDRP